MTIAEEFKKSGYAIVKNLVDKETIARLYEYTLQNMPNGNLKDEQALGSPSFYQDKEMVALHQRLHPKLEELLQLKLFTTFCYYRTYRTGAILRMHKDRRACEISISVNIGQKGNLWDLWLMDQEENARNFALEPGDGLIYRGCQLNHWRGKLVEADLVSQAILSFVDRHGPNKIAIQTELLNRFLSRCRKVFGIQY